MKITIQAVRSRTNHVNRILEELNGADVEVYYDDRLISPLDSFLEMLKIDFDGYRLHLQDDIILARRFVDYLPVVEADMHHHGFDFVSLYASKRKEFNLPNFDQKYYPYRRFLNLQACVFSRRFIDGLRLYVAECQENGTVMGEGKHDDVLLQEYLKHSGIKSWVHLPGLVQHNVYMGSIMGHPATTNRMSRTFDKNFASEWLDANP